MSLKRRQFLGQISCSALGGVSLVNTLLNLRLIGSVAAAENPRADDYRAIVCLFLSGGNDSFNMLTPWSGSEYADYQASRGELALGQDKLTQIFPEGAGNRTFAVNCRMPNLARLFNGGEAAFVANVGTLVEPIPSWRDMEKKWPLGLYSHSDQIEQWQTSVVDKQSTSGWAGRLADILREAEGGRPKWVNISTAGSCLWQAGASSAGFAADPGTEQNRKNGSNLLDVCPAPGPSDSSIPPAWKGWAQQAIERQNELVYPNALQRAYAAQSRSALEANRAFADALSAISPDPSFPNTSLGRQLEIVARTMSGRSRLGASRQTFFVNLGGWDHHDTKPDVHAEMLFQVDLALGAFHQRLAALGLQNNVVIYSASDFGRTLTSNGRGSDHAWGGNQFVVGPVKGKQIHGLFPSLALNDERDLDRNPLDTGQGRLIPSTSCDAFFAEMALWLGMPHSSMKEIFPNMGNFGGPVDFLA